MGGDAYREDSFAELLLDLAPWLRSRTLFNRGRVQLVVIPLAWRRERGRWPHGGPERRFTDGVWEWRTIFRYWRIGPLELRCFVV